MSGRYCSALSCVNNERDNYGMTFFRFPKDLKRCKEWINICNLQMNDEMTPQYCYDNLRLCSIHFEDIMFSSLLKNRLKRDAIPTLFKRVDLQITTDNSNTALSECAMSKCEVNLPACVPDSLQTTSSICRLCLSMDSDQYEKIEKIDQKQFQIVLPEIDLDAVNSPLICAKCMTLLETAYSFKTVCLETEKLLQSHIQMVGRENVDLADVKDYSNTIHVEQVYVQITNDDVKMDNDDNFVDSEMNDDGYKEYVDPLENTSALQCPICSEHCESTHLNFHISGHVNLKKEMKNMIEKHINLYSNKNALQFVCEVCKQTCQNLESLIQHVKSHFELPTGFECLFCSKGYLSKDTLATHLKIHFQRPVCKICNKSFTRLMTLTNHLRTVHNASGTKILEFIDYETNEKGIKDALSKYPDTSDPVDIKPNEADLQRSSKKGRIYKCKLCPKRYLRKCHLNLHASKHRPRPKCTICCKAFMRFQSYKLHMANVHEVTIGANSGILETVTMFPAGKSTETAAIDKLYRCDICGKLLQSKYSLIYHKLSHIRNESLTCPYCHLEYATSAGLTNHIDRVHPTKKKVNPEPKPRPNDTV